MRFVDLFCGLGGMRLGFEAALSSMSGVCVFASEIKSHAVRAYSNNFDGHKVHGDITAVNERHIPDFDVLLAGFPCQAFSAAGKRMGFEDTRGTLFFDIVRILKAKNPTAFILENVEGLVSHKNGATLARMIDILKGLGYFVGYEILDGKDFGLAQSRKRIYITGNRQKHVVLRNFTEKTAVLADIIETDVPPVKSDFTRKLLAHYTPDELIGKQIKDKRGGKSNIHSWDFALKGKVTEAQKELLGMLLKQRRNKKWAEIYGIDWMDGMPLTADMIRTFYDSKNLRQMLDDLVQKGYLVLEHPKKKEGGRRVYDTTTEKGYNIVSGKLSFEYNKILDPGGITPTLVATDALRLGVCVRDGLRSLTVREGLRLFGFPEDYDLDFLTPREAFDLLGNTVCIPVITEISLRLLQTFATSKGELQNVASTVGRVV
ncbi:MAG: DNA (cytosine-5-)-methyltransferase [Defluviitaleaceae bacterium]|nr:DNA (cytosine-5-)-methyltransferase [Defluviitaleaceae bacterium]